MNILDAFILGVVEGITEFLPISSTGHLMLFSKLVGLDQTEFVKSFQVSIQLGAILSVLVLYSKKYFFDFEVLKRIAVAFIPTGIIGFLSYDLIKNYFLESEQIFIWSMFLGGMFLVIFELVHKENREASDDVRDLSYAKCAAIGLFQSIAIIPGISRSAATISGGLILGLKRKVIVEFSFILAVVTMIVASAFDLVKNHSRFAESDFNILAIGFIVSFIFAILSIKFLLNFVRNHSFIGFGIYRMVAAILFWFFILR